MTDSKHLECDKVSSDHCHAWPGADPRQLYVYPTTGTVPLTVTLERERVLAIDGSALTYEYDPEGDGTFLPGTSAKLTTTVYSSAGTYHPRVRITDTKSARRRRTARW